MKKLMIILFYALSLFIIQAGAPAPVAAGAALEDCSTVSQEQRPVCVEKNQRALAVEACKNAGDVMEACIHKYLKTIALNTDCEVADGEELSAKNCQIIRYIVISINLLTGVAGLAIAGGIVLGGYQYMTARDNPGQVQSARMHVTWAIIALLILVFSYAFLQWLVPGGVL